MKILRRKIKERKDADATRNNVMTKKDKKKQDVVELKNKREGAVTSLFLFFVFCIFFKRLGLQDLLDPGLKSMKMIRKTWVALKQDIY